MKVEYLNPFLVATKSVIETMAQMPVRVKSLRSKDGKKTYGVVTGIIGMASETIAGSMIISFSKPCILKIVANMTMEPEKDDIDSEVVDAVGELANMICGGAKAGLSKLDMQFDLSLPTTVIGKDVEIAYRQDTPIIVIPFMTECGEFVVEANLTFRK